MSLSEQDKAELRALLQRATPGSWIYRVHESRRITGGKDGASHIAQGVRWPNARLICWLRNHAAFLLEE